MLLGQNRQSGLPQYAIIQTYVSLCSILWCIWKSYSSLGQ